MDIIRQYQDYPNKDKTVLHIFSNCMFTTGAFRTLIFDTQLKKVLFVPNSLFEFVSQFDGQPLSYIFSSFDKDEHDTVNEYIGFLLDNMIGGLLPITFNCSFSKYDTSYHSPYYFENAIIDIEGQNTDEISAILRKLNQVNIPHIQLRFLDGAKPAIEILMLIESLSFLSFSVIVQYGEVDDKLFQNFSKIDSVILYKSPYFRISVSNKTSFTYTKYNSHNCSGAVEKEYFSRSSNHYFQSQYYNTCLYKKIFISKSGDISNCPYSTTFGNIKDYSFIQLQKLSTDSSFTKNWRIIKDKIEVCRDCEFRNLCTDCRRFIRSTGDIFSKPSSCMYNPYVGKWEGEQGYVSLEKCGAYFENIGFMPDYEKISSVNS